MSVQTLNGKIALITGGSRGLGKNTALKLAENGAGIVLTYKLKKTEALEVASKIEKSGGKAAVLQLDVTDFGSYQAFFIELSKVLSDTFNRKTFDILINNAGVDAHSPFGTTTEATFDLLVNTHFKSVYLLSQQALTIMEDGGKIINISTGLTRFSIPGYGAYAAMKGAVEVLSKYMAKELGPRKITVNVVAPGAIETDFTRAAFEHNPNIKPFLASQTALGRVGQPDDIGSIISFLSSDQAGWINAQRIEASGGMFL